MHRHAWRGTFAILAFGAAAMCSYEARAAEQKAAGGLSQTERATLNRTWEVKEPGKRIGKLPFTESDFSEYGKRVIYKRSLHGEAEDRDANIYNEKGHTTGTVILQVIRSLRDAQKVFAGSIVIAGKRGTPCTVAKAGGSLDIGDVCCFQWDGDPKDISSEDVKHIRRLAFVRNNVLVTIAVQKAAAPADVAGFVKLAHVLDAGLVKALVEDKGQGALAQSTDARAQDPEGKKGPRKAKKVAENPKPQ